MRRILYIQYTNPAGYPPLEHSARILADSGWEVLFLGTGAREADALQFQPHSRISVFSLPFCPAGWKQKVHYLRYAFWVAVWGVRWKPDWIYASDPLSSPIALLPALFPGLSVLYHEHDSPSSKEKSGSWFTRLILAARSALARRAALCLLPNEDRRKRFAAETGRALEKTSLVWNCPSREEAARARGALSAEGLTVFYQGSIVPARLPRTLLRALESLPRSVRLSIVGYGTIGYPDYAGQFRRWAAEAGVSDRVEFLGTMMRKDVLEQARRCDVGLAVLTEQEMEGASNKAFDYLACGLAVLVPNLPGWKRMCVDPGYGLACDPENPGSIAEAIRWFLDHPDRMRTMGEKGRRRILEEWNYEKQFLPVLRQLEGVF